MKHTVRLISERPARIGQPAITEMDIFPTLVEVMQTKLSNQVPPHDGIGLLPLMDGIHH